VADSVYEPTCREEAALDLGVATRHDDEPGELLFTAALGLLCGRDMSRPTPGDGRCLRHAVRGCQCGGAR
jgi:hypothetical protein